MFERLFGIKAMVALLLCLIFAGIAYAAWRKSVRLTDEKQKKKYNGIYDMVSWLALLMFVNWLYFLTGINAIYAI